MGRASPDRDQPKDRAGQRTWLILGLILLGGLLLRTTYLLELRQSPDFASPAADAGFHDYWARGLVTGDWTPQEGVLDPTIPEVPYLRPPGYPYFLAATYALLGPSYLAPRLVQMALGLLNCVLAFLLGRALLGRGVGLILAGFCASYWALIYFEGELQAPVLMVTASLGTLLALRSWVARKAPWRALLGGALIGLTAVIRANALAFIPVAALWMWLAGRRQLRGRAAVHSGLLVLGAALAICPVTIRNKVVSGEAVLISCNGAVNLYIGNNEASDGIKAVLPDLSLKHRLSGWSWFAYPQIVRDLRADGVESFAGASSYFSDRALDYIRAHPGRFLSLCLKRAALFWGPAEISNNKALEAEKASSWTLRFLPPFPVALALSLLGLGLLVLDTRAGRRSRTDAPMLWVMGLFVLVYFGSFVPFLAAARFRVPVLPLVFVFGAYGLYRVGQLSRQRRWDLVGLALAPVVVLSLGLAAVGQAAPVVRPEVNRAWRLTNRGSAWLRQGKPEAAIEEFEKALAERPGFLDAERQLAEAYELTGRFDDAIRLLGELARSFPQDPEFKLRQARVLLRRGNPPDLQAAGTVLLAILASSPDFAEARFLLAQARERSGQLPAAIEEYRRAAASFARARDLDPANEFARRRQLACLIGSGLLLAKTGALDEAIAAYRQAVQIDPRRAEPRANLAVALADKAVKSGDLRLLDEAIAELERAVGLSPANASMRRSLEQMKRFRAQKR